ncbi:hemolysin family protein [Salinirubellus sp. GCM10025818]|uniref:hemolysin family protein n=1 Tax=Salinirubellus TaxID=2162630 RepID=UPI0030CAE463
MATLSTSAGVLLLVALTAVSAFFSSTEISIFSLENHRVETMEGRGIEALRRLRDDPHRLLVTILVGNNFVNAAIAAVTTALLTRSLSATDAALVSTFVVGTVVLIFGEILPKSYGVANAESWSRRVAGPVVFLQRLLYPVVAVFDTVTGAMNTLIGGGRDIERPYVTREDITAMVETAERLGVIEGDEQTLIERVFEFSGTTVADVMIPRTDVVAVDADGTVGAALETCLDARITRAPAYRGSLDEVVGYVDVRDLARANPAASLDEFLLPIIHAFESRRVDETLAAMQAGEGELAVVFDEFGAVEGLLTAEDIVEELVGEILDVGERRRVVPLPDGGVRARGIATVGAVNDALDGPALPGDPAATIAGLLVDALGRPPERGERIEFDGTLVSIEAVEDNRVRRVVVERRTGEHEGPDGGGTDRNEVRTDERPPGNGDGNADGEGNGGVSSGSGRPG